MNGASVGAPYVRVPRVGEVVLLHDDNRFWMVVAWVWCLQHNHLVGLRVAPEVGEGGHWDRTDQQDFPLDAVDEIILAWSGMERR